MGSFRDFAGDFSEPRCRTGRRMHGARRVGSGGFAPLRDGRSSETLDKSGPKLM